MDYEVADATGDNDTDGWINLAEWNAYTMAQSYMDPRNDGSGGQVISLVSGWNLVGYDLDKAWYDSAKSVSPTTIATTIVDVNAGGWQSIFGESLEGHYKIKAYHSDRSFDSNLPAQSDLDYIIPEEGFWLWVEASGDLVLDGKRIDHSGSYEPIDLINGWNLVSFQAKKNYQMAGWPSTLGTSTNDEYGTEILSGVAETLQAAFGLDTDTEWPYVDSISVIYSDGGRAYKAGFPEVFQSLRFVVAGYSYYIKATDGGVAVQYGD